MEPRKRKRDGLSLLLSKKKKTTDPADTRHPPTSTAPPVVNTASPEDSTTSQIGLLDPSDPVSSQIATGTTVSEQTLTSNSTLPLRLSESSIDATASTLATSAEIHGENGDQFPAALPAPRDLWKDTVEGLNEDERSRLRKYFNVASADANESLTDILSQLKLKQEICAKKRWTFQFGKKKISIRDEADKVIDWLERFKQAGDIAVNADPLHAGLPWALIRVILQLSVSERDQICAIVLGLERVTYVLNRCKVYSRLYLESFASQFETGNSTAFTAGESTHQDHGSLDQEQHSRVEVDRSVQTKPKESQKMSLYSKEEREGLTTVLVGLYTLILRFLIKAVSVLQANTLVRTARALWKLDEIATFNRDCAELERVTERIVTNLERELQLARHQTISEKLGNLSQQVDDLIQLGKSDGTLLSHLQRLWQTRSKERQGKILSWVSPLPHRDHHAVAAAGRTEGTGDWLLNRDEYLKWETSDDSMILWLHGIPGSGKTKLVSHVIDIWSERETEFTRLAYFYCRQDEESRRKGLNILQSFVKQLASNSEATRQTSKLHKGLTDLYEEKEQSGFASAALTTNEAIRCLQDLLGSYTQTILILDALDECQEADRAFLVDTFDDLARRSTCVKILISSRRSDDIVRWLKRKANVGIEARDNQNDIRLFIQSKLKMEVERRRRLRIRAISQDLIDEVTAVIFERSKGMFQWAALQIDQLLSLQRETDIRKRLGTLPAGLTETYDDIISRIEAQEGSAPTVALNVIQWLLISEEPIPMRVMVAAALQDPSDDEVSPTDMDADFVLGCCQHLAVLDETGNCRFSHLSVREYLEKANHWSVRDSQEKVLNVCLKILLSAQDTFTGDEHLLDLKYFVFQHWHSLTQQFLNETAQEEFSERQTLFRLRNFLGNPRNPSPQFLQWVQAGKRQSPLTQLLTPCHPIFFVVLAGIKSIFNEWLDPLLFDCNLANNNGETLLSLAIFGEHMTFAKALIDQGANINTNGLPLYAALEVKWTHGDIRFLSMLLRMGANPNVLVDGAFSLIQKAVEKDDPEVLMLLLQAGADPNQPLFDYSGQEQASIIPTWTENLFSKCFRSGKYEMARLLLKWGADPTTPWIDTQTTALIEAVRLQDLALVKDLLEAGVDPRRPGRTYGSFNPLITALLSDNNRRVDMINMLLRHGSKFDDGHPPGFALTLVCSVGDLKMAEFLLDHGAEVNRRCDTLYMGIVTPLEAATWKDQRATVQLLMRRGATIDDTADSQNEDNTSLLLSSKKDQEANRIKSKEERFRERLKELLEGPTDTASTIERPGPIIIDFTAPRRKRRELLRRFVQD
ncbi:hypothetical protein EJ04DRAFT_565274 [Polyplosphaeria fusca]|uniref:Nephrocystin 3-like N-terminal domain-containing protein n=1 Tax=Polyplosphaeria fusca TaxID=682080 RepID=A0A9P4QV21_9PLEO|nr:hypothetical protein EJ04DRAFT_565274 [Polyplosphaeria fusca]